ncbi:hypothetical protein [Streptococcus loxodontisalivarius]|uniref:Uncharacterized protein n=1 Tax=Streptococcus loxodontisalivarius TaxID=1349415 RepID=A0ABS2PRG4_9STRE|nr:hypothetical protein [Streptococcus loxodontisalivarius]MBM7642624.1 hypothetical protein [Streptococcus loxodontisalivarius]
MKKGKEVLDLKSIKFVISILVTNILIGLLIMTPHYISFQEWDWSVFWAYLEDVSPFIAMPIFLVIFKEYGSN